MELKHRHALITGASSGIGHALARELASKGCRVTVAARRLETLEALVEDIQRDGGQAAAARADLSHPGSGFELAARVREAHGPVDILVNNAGVSGGVNMFLSKSPAEMREAVEVNFAQPMALAHRLLPDMVEKGSGVLVSVVTASVFFPTSLASVYVATKRALASVDEILRMELAGSGVHVLTVYPGPVDTPMLQQTMQTDPRARQVLGRFMGTPQELARLTAEAIRQEKDTLVYPRKFGVGRWISPLVGPVLARLAEPLGLNR